MVKIEVLSIISINQDYIISIRLLDSIVLHIRNFVEHVSGIEKLAYNVLFIINSIVKTICLLPDCKLNIQ